MIFSYSDFAEGVYTPSQIFYTHFDLKYNLYNECY